MPRTWEDLRRELEQSQQDAFMLRHGIHKPADTELAANAGLRTRMHQTQRSHRPLAKDFDLVGLAGEKAFCDWIGIPLDRTLRPQGSGGINYTVNGYTINVYCHRKPYHLLVEATPKATKADVYVLTRFDDATKTATILDRCWATREEVLSVPPRDVGGMGVASHAIPARALRMRDELLAYLKVQREGDQLSLFG